MLRNRTLATLPVIAFCSDCQSCAGECFCQLSSKKIPFESRETDGMAGYEKDADRFSAYKWLQDKNDKETTGNN